MAAIMGLIAIGVVIYGVIQLLPTWVSVVILSVSAAFIGLVFVEPQIATIGLIVTIGLGLVATIIALIVKFWSFFVGIVMAVLVIIGVLYGFASFANATATHSATVMEKVEEVEDYDTCIEIIGDNQEVLAMEGYEARHYEDDDSTNYANATSIKGNVLIEMYCVNGKYLFYKFKLTPLK